MNLHLQKERAHFGPTPLLGKPIRVDVTSHVATRSKDATRGSWPYTRSKDTTRRDFQLFKSIEECRPTSGLLIGSLHGRLDCTIILLDLDAALRTETSSGQPSV